LGKEEDWSSTCAHEGRTTGQMSSPSHESSYAAKDVGSDEKALGRDEEGRG
jgi:hypothetical protein